MNICFIKGKVIEEVDFKFYYCSKHISKAIVKIELENKSIITIKGYDEMADWMYHYIETQNVLIVQGRVDNNMEVEVEWCRICLERNMLKL